MAEDCSQQHPAAFDAAPNEIADDLKHTLAQMRKKFHEAPEKASQIVAELFPAAKEFLKERFAVSIQRRRTSFMSSKRQADEDNDSGDITKQSTKSEGEAFHRPLNLQNSPTRLIESTRWAINDDFPKPPQTYSSQSHFVCQICFLPIPSEEAEGDLWIQHISRDLKPYICLVEGCQNPQSAFDTIEAWTQHMKEDRKSSASYVQMSCPLCSHQPDEDAAGSLSTTAYEDLQKHIACHLQSLALISIPPSASDSVPRPEGKDLRREIPAQSNPGSQKTTVPSGNQVYPARRFNEHSRTILSRPPYTQTVGPPLLQEGSSMYSKVPRPWEEGTANTEAFDVLIAEDNLVNQRILRRILEKYSHRLVVTSNGQEALDAIKKRKYDVILMDISMPIMGGGEATEKIREYERNFGITRTPIVAMHAHSMPYDKENLMKLQIDDQFIKPLRLPEPQEKILQYGRLGRIAAKNDDSRFLASISANAEARMHTASNYKSML